VEKLLLGMLLGGIGVILYQRVCAMVVLVNAVLADMDAGGGC
jgi:hypothetical protein